MGIDIDKLKEIVAGWASGLRYKSRVYLFGSQLKGTAKNESDIDIAVEFLEPISAFLWFDHHEEWQNLLSQETGMKVQLELYESDEFENLKSYLKEASMILYDSTEL